jgi:hypothetical protein
LALQIVGVSPLVVHQAALGYSLVKVLQKSSHESNATVEPSPANLDPT